MSPQFLILIVLLFGALWFVLIRPQKRRQLEQRQMLENLAPGDEILTAGGFYGTVTAIEGDDVHVEIAPGTEARIARRAVAAIIPPESEETQEGEAEELEEEGEADDAVDQAVHAGAEGAPPDSRS